MAALTLAIPSKGRLKEKCDEFFVTAGLSMQQTSDEELQLIKALIERKRGQS